MIPSKGFQLIGVPRYRKMFYEVVGCVQSFSASWTTWNSDARRILLECMQVVATDFGLERLD
jgi:hypothetical protein